MAAHTVFMTPEESARVQQTVRDREQRCREQAGQPRQAPSEPRALVEQAVSAAVMQDFASTAFGLGGGGAQKQGGGGGGDSLVAYAVGRPYPPCTAELATLAPMRLADLRMETHHRGRVLSVRRVAPVVELRASSWTVVQGDAPGDVERLELFLHKTRHGRDVLECGAEFLIKEPYYTLSHQGEPTLRVDHPSDVVISAYCDDPDAWRDTTRSAAPAAGRTASQCKDDGNAALQKQRYWRAHAFYSEGLALLPKQEKEKEDEEPSSTTTLRRDLHRNRAHVNLLLQRFDEARSDALASLTRGDDAERRSLDAKAYYRAGSAAYALGRFEEARGFFEEQLRREPANQNAQVYQRRIALRLREQATGDYDFRRIAAGLARTQGRADAASFDGPTEVRESPGAGRGLFATRDLAAGEVVLAEKAFCVVWSHEAGALSAVTCDLREDAAIRIFPAGLHRAVVQKLLDNPSQAERVLALHGAYAGLGPRLVERDGAPVVDAFQVHDIVQCNAFGPGGGASEGEGEEDVTRASAGLWARAAYVNHSCVPSATPSYAGDLMVLRAARRIARGEEITHCYDATADYEARAASLRRTWGFACGCALCAAEQADGAEVRRARRALAAEAGALARREDPRSAKRLVVAQARRLRQRLDDTYDSARYAGLPRRALVEIDQWLQAATAR